VLTLDATLAPQSTQLLQQLPPVNSSAVQAGFTVSACLAPPAFVAPAASRSSSKVRC
jgi:hypothetical protein